MFNQVPGALNSTSSVFIGQNMGAKKNRRARQAFAQCLAMACGIGVVLGVSIYLTGMWCIYPLATSFPMLMACFLVSNTLVLLVNVIGCFALCRKKLR